MLDRYDAIHFDTVLDAVFGLYFWEWFITLDFDFAFICGRRKFKWPMIFYFYARYAFLAALVGSFLLNNGRSINCQALYMTTFLLKHSALWASSVSLSIRTMTLWGYSHRIMVIIVPLIAFHLAAAFLSSILDLESRWSEVAVPRPRCVVLNISFFGIASLYTYTVVLDFIILCLTSYKLLYGAGARIKIKRIPIFMLLFRDGLVYFVLVFILTLLAVVYVILDRKIATAIGVHVIPGTATIVAGRAVRRLYNYAGPVPETAGADDGMSLTIPNTPNIYTESEIP
ncbi:hypothetical protein C8J56DRAFT_1058177 [Mycena floridula]|nr:hypothetical protein C8J56DRAFT_1059135 [Mycena floridula]KAJ7580536.1 hypothetical protein C8J56DRAFT_1058177 [Mycena floridula]